MVDSNQWFYFTGGKVAKDISDLKEVLHHISDQEFSFHVNAQKNDFANWIEGVFNEEELASKLRRVYERHDVLSILHNFLSRKEHNQEHSSHSSNLSNSDDLQEDDSKKSNSYEDSNGDFGSLDTPEIEDEHEEHLMLDEPKKFEEIGYRKDEDSNDYDNYDGCQIPSPPRENFVSSTGKSVEEPSFARREKSLSEKELEKIVDDTKHDLEIEGREIHKSRNSQSDLADETKSKFIVKEFIYGFIVGLIFGLIMLGALLNLNVCY